MYIITCVRVSYEVQTFRSFDGHAACPNANKAAQAECTSTRRCFAKGWGAENCRCHVPFLGFVADENLQNMKPAAVNSSKDAQHVDCEAGWLPCAFFARAPVSSEDSCAWTPRALFNCSITLVSGPTNLIPEHIQREQIMATSRAWDLQSLQLNPPTSGAISFS